MPYSGSILNKTLIGVRVSRVITPGFPFEVILESKSPFLINDLQVLHQIAKEEFNLITNIIEY